MKDKEKINAVAEAVAKILEAEMKVPYGEGDKEVKDGPAIRSHKAKPVDPKDYTDKLDKKYAKPSPFAGDVKEEMHKDDETPGKKLMSRLKGKQYKLDKNRNGKLDAHDFKMLRGEKSVDEAALGVPLKGHPYHKKTDAELKYIQKDAAEAAKAMKGHSPRSEAKYLDQVNDASTVLHYRSKGGKQLAKESVESIDELSKKSLLSYLTKATKQEPENIAAITKANKENDPATADKALSKFAKRSAGMDRSVSKMYAKYDKPKNESVEIDEAQGNLHPLVLKATQQANLHPHAHKVLQHISPEHRGRYMPHLQKGVYTGSYSDRASILSAAEKAGHTINESVEIDEADYLTMRGLHTANPQSIPSYMRSTEKGKRSLADKNKPVLKDLIKRQLGKHPKPNLPEAVEKPTHIVSKELLSDHKRWMDSEGFDTHTVPLPKSHPKHATHVGIVAKNNNEAGYHEDGFARPIKESVESIDEISTAQMGHAGKTTLKHIKNPGVGLRMAAHDVKPGIKGYRDRVDLMKAADAEGKLKKEEAEGLEEKKGDSDLGTFTDNNMGEMTDAQMKERERIVKGMKKGLAGFKERYGKRAKDVMYATATKQAMKDEAVDPNVKTTDTLAGTIKGGEANQFKSYKVKLKAEEMGCENTPMSRATNLAKAAYKKLKNETMMGKAGGTSEEKK
jgi:hypothetical protein